MESDVVTDLGLQVPLAHASLFGRFVSETNHQKGMSHEALVKVRIDDGLSLLSGCAVTVL